MKWFKFYGQDWLTDMKVNQLQAEDKLAFVTLLCLASSSDVADGVIRNCSEEVVLHLCGFHYDPLNDENEYNRAKGCFERLADHKMITFGNDASVIIPNFAKRQGENLTGYERVKRYRERKKTLQNKDISNDNVDNANDNVRGEEIRVDKNREEKKEASISYLRKIPESDILGFTSRFEITRIQLFSLAENLELYCKSKGKVYRNYKAFLTNAIKRDKDKYPERKKEKEKVDVKPEMELTAEQKQRIEEIKAKIGSKFLLKQ